MFLHLPYSFSYITEQRTEHGNSLIINGGESIYHVYMLPVSQLITFYFIDFISVCKDIT